MTWTLTSYDPKLTTIKNHLDAKWTFPDRIVTSRVIASEIIDDIYFAAIERSSKASGISKITAIVSCIETYSDGIFAYNALGQGVLHHFIDCPRSILMVLSPTEFSQSKCENSQTPKQNLN